MIRRWLLGLAAGLLAGSTVGLVEALWILTTSGAPAEYVALFYAVVLYGLVGLVSGAATGLGVVLLGLVWRGLGDAGAWTLGFMTVLLGLGGAIILGVVDRVVYLEQGVSATGQAVLWSLGLVVALVGFWILPILMTRTPLKILLQPKGTAALWSGLVLLAAVFSFAPGGPHPHGTLRPERGQDPILRNRPNVLLVVVDSLRADHVGPLADWPADHTPTLDALAAEGVVFEQAYAAASWTRPSVASLFTSLLPGSHLTATKSAVLPHSVTTIAEMLQEQGWVTGGLPNSIDVTRSFHFQQGFDFFRYLAPDYLLGATESASQLSLYALVRELRARLLPAGLRATDYYQPAPVVLDHAREFIQAQDTGRWFLFVHLMEPHDPYFNRPLDGTGHSRTDPRDLAPPPSEARGAAYAGEVAAVDEALGDFFSWLRSGHWDDTLVVVIADHGVELQDHGGVGHGVTLYDEQLHVPLIIKLPGSQRAGQRAPWQVRSLDVAPTVAAQLGLQPPAAWQGTDLFDPSFEHGQRQMAAQAAAIARGDAAVQWVREPGVYAEDRVVVAQENYGGSVLSSIRAGGWKYIKAEAPGPRGLEREELFHVSVDPRERTNLAGGAGVVQARLHQQLTEVLSKARAEAAGGRDPALDEAASERMRALGYPE